MSRSDLDRHTPKPPPGPWAQRGNCVGVGSSLFFGERSGDATGEAAEAKKVCAACVVSDDCLEYALTTPVEQWGVWGGTAYPERKKLAKGRAS